MRKRVQPGRATPQFSLFSSHRSQLSGNRPKQTASHQSQQLTHRPGPPYSGLSFNAASQSAKLAKTWFDVSAVRCTINPVFPGFLQQEKRDVEAIVRRTKIRRVCSPLVPAVLPSLSLIRATALASSFFHKETNSINLTLPPALVPKANSSSSWEH